METKKINCNDYDMYVLQGILRAVIPNSAKGNFTSIDDIMQSPKLVNGKITKEKVLSLLVCSKDENGDYYNNLNNPSAIFRKRVDNAGKLLIMLDGDFFK